MANPTVLVSTLLQEKSIMSYGGNKPDHRSGTNNPYQQYLRYCRQLSIPPKELRGMDGSEERLNMISSSIRADKSLKNSGMMMPAASVCDPE